MEIYDEYYIDATPMEASQQKHMTKQQMPQPASQTNQTTFQETIHRNVIDRRRQSYEDLVSEETGLKQGMERSTFTLTPSEAQLVNTMSTTIPTITRSSISSNSFARSATESIDNRRAPFQGRISTLSSVVGPTPTAATRTVAITREES